MNGLGKHCLRCSRVYGPNVLPLDLDHFCLSIQRELHEVTAVRNTAAFHLVFATHAILQHPCQDPDTYIFTDWNQPFAPADRRSANEMLNDEQHPYHHPEAGAYSIRRTLLKSWQGVDEMTRK